MTVLPIQSELRERGLVDVVKKYSLRHKRHGEHQNLVLFKYDQIDSPVGEPAVWDCRALILDEANNWSAVAFPYRRFFNYGEAHAPPINWSKARIFDKEDGSLITLYHYAGKWHASTSGTPDGSSRLSSVYHRDGSESSKTFAQRFFELLGPRIPHGAEHMCFMFELCTMENRILVEHTTPRIVLHGARNMATLEEVPPDPWASMLGWEMCKSYPFSTIDEVIAAADKLNPNEGEGFVVWDGDNRNKIKGAKYVALHHIANGCSPRRLLEIVRTNEQAEWLAYFPAMRSQIDEIRAKYDALIADVERDYAQISGIESQKDFAAEATKTRHSAPLFRMRKGQSARQFYAASNIHHLCELLGLDASEAEQE
jgi:hypothetical protein